MDELLFKEAFFKASFWFVDRLQCPLKTAVATLRSTLVLSTAFPVLHFINSF
jgi:hypothetical protein